MQVAAKRLFKGFSTVLLAVLCLSCGSASNNDQGVAFTLYGFFNPTDSSPMFGIAVPLTTDPESEASLSGVFVTWGVQNNLEDQGIRTQRAFLSFYVEGAEIQPPSTTLPLGLVLGPAAITGNGSIPDGFNFGNQGLANQFVVPPDVMNFIVLNKNRMPELPFTMTARASVTGITSAGDRLTTNDLDFFVQFTPDNIITPSAGSETTGAATGDSTANSGLTDPGITDSGVTDSGASTEL